LLSALLAILPTLRRTLGLNLLAMFAPATALLSTLCALLAILPTLRRSLGLNLLVTFATATALLSTLSALLALLAVLSALRLTLGLKLLATFVPAAASPTANILRSGLEAFLLAVPFMFAAFGTVLVLQIRVRILRSHGAAKTRRLFAPFPVPLVLTLALLGRLHG